MSTNEYRNLKNNNKTQCKKFQVVVLSSKLDYTNKMIAIRTYHKIIILQIFDQSFYDFSHLFSHEYDRY